MTLSVPPARRILAIAALTVLLAACAHSGPRNPLATWVPSKNFDERRPVVIVLLDSVGKLTRVGDANRIKRWMENTHASRNVRAQQASFKPSGASPG